MSLVPQDVAEYLDQACQAAGQAPLPVEAIRTALQQLTVSQVDISAACPIFNLAEGVRIPLFLDPEAIANGFEGIPREVEFQPRAVIATNQRMNPSTNAGCWPVTGPGALRKG